MNNPEEIIANMFKTFEAWINYKPITFLGNGRPGKLTLKQVVEIRCSTLKQKELAIMYDVCPGTICKIKKSLSYNLFHTIDPMSKPCNAGSL